MLLMLKAPAMDMDIQEAMAPLAAMFTVEVLVLAMATATVMVMAPDMVATVIILSRPRTTTQATVAAMCLSSIPITMVTMDTATQRELLTLTPGTTQQQLLRATLIQLAGGVPTNNIDLPLSHTAQTISPPTSMRDATSRMLVHQIII